MKAIGEVFFYLHIIIFAIWIGLFFVPISLFPSRVVFHFWFIVSLYIIQYATGLFYLNDTKSWRSICPLTILMQRLRGFGWHDPKTYNHGFVAELWTRCGLPTSKKQVNVMQHITLIIVALQYFFGFLVF